MHKNLFYEVMSLKPDYRVIILLYYYEGYSIGEISKLLCLPTGTVGTRLSRARNQLKTKLLEVWFDD